MSRKNDILFIGFGAFAPRPYPIIFVIKFIITMIRVIVADIRVIFWEIVTLSSALEFVIM